MLIVCKVGWLSVVLRGVGERSQAPKGTVGGGLSRRCGRVICPCDEEPGCPLGVGQVVGAGELVEVDGGVGRNGWADPGVRGQLGSVNVSRNGPHVGHGLIITSHELNGHRGPFSRGISGPLEFTLSTNLGIGGSRWGGKSGGKDRVRDKGGSGGGEREEHGEL